MLWLQVRYALVTGWLCRLVLGHDPRRPTATLPHAVRTALLAPFRGFGFALKQRPKWMELNDGLIVIGDG